MQLLVMLVSMLLFRFYWKRLTTITPQNQFRKPGLTFWSLFCEKKPERTETKPFKPEKRFGKKLGFSKKTFFSTGKKLIGVGQRSEKFFINNYFGFKMERGKTFWDKNGSVFNESEQTLSFF